MLHSTLVSVLIALVLPHADHASVLQSTALHSVTPHSNAIVVPPGIFAVHDLESTYPPSNTTLGVPFVGSAHARSLLTRQTASPEILFICSGLACTDICVTYDLSTVSGDVSCTITETFQSVLIFQPSGRGLTFNVVVGPVGCEVFTQIPAVNECFNTGAPFGDTGIRNFV